MNRISHTLICFLSFPSLATGGDFTPLPKPTGTYSVGVKVLEIFAPPPLSAEKNAASTLSKKTTDKTPRRSTYTVQVFYPSKPHKENSPYLPIIPKEEAPTELPTFLSSAKLQAECLPGYKFPALLFVPNLGEHPSRYTMICSEVASHGYVMCSIDLSRFPYANLPNENPFRPDDNDFSDNMKKILPDLKAAEEEILNLLPALAKHSEIQASAIPASHADGLSPQGELFQGAIGLKAGVPIALASTKAPLPFVSILDTTETPLLNESGADHFMLFFNDPTSANAQHYKNWCELSNAQHALYQLGQRPFYRKWTQQENLPFATPLADDVYMKTASEHTLPEVENFLKTLVQWLNWQTQGAIKEAP